MQDADAGNPPSNQPVHSLPRSGRFGSGDLMPTCGVFRSCLHRRFHNDGFAFCGNLLRASAALTVLKHPTSPSGLIAPPHNNTVGKDVDRLRAKT